MTTATVLERGIFVDGAVEPVAAPMLTIANPGTGETVGRATRADAVAVDRAVRSAHAAFADWSRRGYADRGAILRAGADALLARVDAPRERLIDCDDCLDALVCALVARAAQLGRTIGPQDERLARLEGWIHLPEPDSLSRL